MPADVQPLTPIFPMAANLWRMSRPMLPSEWTERHRLMGADSTMERWSFALAPQTRFAMDLAADPYVEEIIYPWATRTGKTQSVNNILGWIVNCRPGNLLYVRETEEAVDQFKEDRLRRFIESNPEVSAHMLDKWRSTDSAIRFDRMSMYMGSANNSTSLVSKDCRYVAADEVSLYPKTCRPLGTSPIHEMRNRTRSFSGHGRKIILMGTPSPDPEVGIWPLAEAASVVYRWQAACPHCGTWQTWQWGEVDKDGNFLPGSSVRYDKRPEDVTHKAWAEHLLKTQRVWMTCAECGQDANSYDHPRAIHEVDRRRMLAAGRWVADGEEPGSETRPRGRTVALHLSALESLLPGNALHELAAEWLNALDGGPAAIAYFWTALMARPKRQGSRVVEMDSIRTRKNPKRKMGIVPADALILTATMDVQGDGIFYLVRAWGGGKRSWLVEVGFIQRVEGVRSDYALLERQVLKRDWPIEGDPNFMRVTFGLIDSGGDRTFETYEWCAEWNKLNPKRRVHPCKGEDGKPKSGKNFFLGRPGGQLKGQKREYLDGLQLFILYVWAYQDMLDKAMTRPTIGEAHPDAPCWELPEDVPEWYLRHMTSMRREESGAWVMVRDGLANHLRDCEVYAMAAADIAEPFVLRLTAEDGRLILKRREARRAAASQPPAPKGETTAGGRMAPGKRY